MTDPVMDEEANTYERSAIVAEIERTGKSPVSGSPITVAQLMPNASLKMLIAKAGFPVAGDGDGEAPAGPGEAAAGPGGAEDDAGFSGVDLTLQAHRDPDRPNRATVLASIKPPDGDTRTPSDICCVIDVSGSMGAEATVQGAGGKNEQMGLSMLDVVKHAVKTIIESLTPEDRLSVVSYSSTAQTVFELMSMDTAGKLHAAGLVDRLTPGGNTNLWDGLQTGLENLRQGGNKDRFAHIMLLTDGMPNINPPRGHLPMLKRYKDENQQLSCTINTFGFGYNLDSVLLRELAVEGHGMYAFIPDSGFVGTVFVNSLSSLLATQAMNVELNIENSKGCKVVPGEILGGHMSTGASWGAQINLGCMQYGGPKDVVFSIELPDGYEEGDVFCSVTLKADTLFSKITLNIVGNSFGPLGEIEVQRSRLRAVDAIRQALDTARGGAGLSSGQRIVATEILAIQKSVAAGDERVKKLLEDLQGQVTQAISRPDWFKKWGVHYLPSLLRAHLMQVCNNFKDPGVQVYAGKLFSTLRDQGDAIFLKLPPPKPSRRRHVAPGAAPGGAAPAPRAPVDMSVYMNRNAGCIAGEGQVLLAAGGLRSMNELKKGDMVQTPQGGAEVLCVVRTACTDGQADLVALPGGVHLTPFHPVRVQGVWHFPLSLNKVQAQECDFVYNAVLAEHHVLVVSGSQCVTLGHGFVDEVVKHDYLGTRAVVDDLAQLQGWEEGLVDLTSQSFVRDAHTGLVAGLRQC